MYEPEVERYTRDFCAELVDMRKREVVARNKDAEIGGIVINTITYMVYTNGRIDLQKLYDNAALFDGFDMKRSAKDAESPVAPVMNRSLFQNQLTFTFVDFSRKSTKVFSKGIFQVTGCTSAMECLRLISRFLVKALKVPGLLTSMDGRPDLKITKIRSAMICCDFDCKRVLRLRPMRDVVSAMPGTFACFETDNYPGLRIKLRKDQRAFLCTIIVFHSGKIILTGSPTVEGIISGYEFFCKILTSRSDEVVSSFGIDRSDKPAPRKRKKGNPELIDGKPEDVLLQTAQLPERVDLLENHS